LLILAVDISVYGFRDITIDQIQVVKKNV